MRADELEVGASFAYAKYWMAHPLRAEVLEEPDSGHVSVRITHPDLGGETQQIETKDLANDWDAVPDPRFTAHHAAAKNGLTWHQIADAAYAHVQRSRALADRLTALGIPRGHRHYAGRGGTMGDLSASVQLVLDHDELEKLIGLAENTGGHRVDPTAITSTVETTT